MEDKRYPIYRFSARWNQVGFENNSTGFDKMYKEEPSEELLKQDLANFKKLREDKQIEENKPITEWLELEYKYIEHESWVIHWFNHMTYNLFETDFEVEKSFRDFIRRKKQLNRENGHGETEMRDYDNRKPFYCFMGAEDSWRWKICRCEHCVAMGKITIDH